MVVGTVVVKGGGGAGLGDRLRAVISGVAVAKLTGRQLFVDWTDGRNAPEGVNAFTELLDVPGLDLADKLPESDSVDPASWRGHLPLSMDALYRQDGCPPWSHQAAVERYSTDLSKIDRPEEVLVLFDFLQFAKLRPALHARFGIPLDWPDTRAQTPLFREHLAPRQEVRAAIDEFATARFTAHPVIGVHVRLTREAVAQKGLVPLARYFAAIDCILAANREGMIFLATDNAEISQAFAERYPRCVSREKWFGAPGEPLHLNPSCPDPLQQSRDALVDMLLLARCDYLLHAGTSSFSLLAAVAAGLPAGREIIVGREPPAGLRRILAFAERAAKQLQRRLLARST